jgi:hypothetical protein
MNTSGQVSVREISDMLTILDILTISIKKAASLNMRNGLCFGEPCRNRTDNLMIKRHPIVIIILNTYVVIACI